VHAADALILGLVQGLTEFLPISSSAHIRIVGELLGTGSDPGARFTAIIQLGTEAAVLIYFRRDIARIFARWFRSLRGGRVPREDPDARMGWLIIIGSVPIILLGIAFQNLIETSLRSLWVVAATLILFGILLGLADQLGSRTRRLDDLTGKHGILFGLAQALALIPGVSRSGGTITAGLALGYERAAAARYSFLLALPAVFGSGLYELFRSIRSSCTAAPGVTCIPDDFGAADTALATIVAFGTGFAVIVFFMRYISTRSFLPFVVYRLVVGGGLIALLATGAVEA
jgi:undecaprenyl-diphosphatase